ncbi:MAG: efflux transporter outer membrane subunit [Azospirillaceae bacterium]|nr:efflux transporter outer membrane subunit [Azospirillaceae bacterium]
MTPPIRALRPGIVFAALSLSTLLLGACVRPDGLHSDATMADANRLQIAATTVGVAKTAPWPTLDWWHDYQDPQLDALIAEGLSGSPSLRVADARIRRAAAATGQAQAALFPALRAGAAPSLERFNENGLFPAPFAGNVRTNNQIALDGSYTLDLWGGKEAEFRAALGALRASEVDRQTARLDLTTAIAQAYVRLAGEWDQLEISRDLLRQKHEIKALSDGLLRAGLVTEVEVQQAAAAIAATEAEISASEERVALLQQQLAVLVGAGPDRGATIGRPRLLVAHDLALPATLPAELIGRRPDIVAQRWRIEAAVRTIDATKATFYPNINLSASLGLQSVGIDKFFMASSTLATIGPAITLPVFDAGRLRANLAMADADFDIAVETYNGTIIAALQDVVGQLTSWHANESALTQEHVAVAHLRDADRLAILRFREGLSNYLTVLSAEGELTAERRNEARAQNRQLVIAVALVHALGGGYQPGDPPVPNQPPADQTRS